MGGTGATLVVPFMFMWLCKSKRNRIVGRASVVPTFFGVNEPILFGAPIVLNPIFFIPFVTAPIINVWIMKFFVDVLQMNSFSIILPWTTPAPIGIVMG
ncbi:PTS transporter subunit EIIC, partial [Streptococcus pneumoniae]